MIGLQAGRGIKAVQQQKIRGQKPQVALRHPGELVIRHEQGESRDFRRMPPGQFARHARADGFADHIARRAGGQPLEGLLGGGAKTGLAGRSFAGAVAGILQHIHLHVRRLVNGPRQVIAPQRAASIAMDNQHAAGGHAPGGNLPADDPAGLVFPRTETMVPGHRFDDVGRNFRWEINQVALEDQHHQQNDQINDEQQLQHAEQTP